MSKHVTAVAAVLVAPVAILGACTTNQSSKQTTPSSPSTSATSPGQMTTQLKTADGRVVANASLDFANGYATVTVETVAAGILNPGFHGLHIHSVGKCEPNSVPPTGGPPGDFESAGGHFQKPGHTGNPESGALTALQVRSDGSGKLVTTTDAFTKADLEGPEGTALIIHDGTDTLANADAAKRVACGVISPASSTSTVTTTVTSPVTPVPPATTGATTTTTTTPSTSETTTTTTTSTTTAVTTTVPTTMTTTTTAPPGG